MGSTSLLLHFACLLAPTQHDGSATFDQTQQERAPVILHVARELPQLQSVSPLRASEAQTEAGIQPVAVNRPVSNSPRSEEQDEKNAGGLSLNPAAPRRQTSANEGRPTTEPAISLHAAADPTKRPPRPETAPAPRLNVTEDQNAPATIASKKTPDAVEVEVPEVLRVRPRETAKPAPAATPSSEVASQRAGSSIRDVDSNGATEPTHVAARTSPSGSSNGLTPPRRLFDTSPIGSGVRRMPQERSSDDRWAGAEQFRVEPGASAAPSVSSSARARTGNVGSEPESVTSPMQVLMAGPGSFAVGQANDFQVVITNHSNEVIDEALVQLTPSVGFRVTVLDRDAAMDQASGIVQWRVANLEPGSQEVIRFKAVASRQGKMVHTLNIVDREGNQSSARVSTVAVVARRGRR